MEFDIEKLRNAVQSGQVEWRKHTLQRLAERNISQKEALTVLLLGEVIRYYPDDRPFPSALVFSFVGSRPLHVVASYDSEYDLGYIITVYEPSLEVFEPDYKTKRK